MWKKREKVCKVFPFSTFFYSAFTPPKSPWGFSTCIAAASFTEISSWTTYCSTRMATSRLPTLACARRTSSATRPPRRSAARRTTSRQRWGLCVYFGLSKYLSFSLFRSRKFCHSCLLRSAFYAGAKFELLKSLSRSSCHSLNVRNLGSPFQNFVSIFEQRLHLLKIGEGKGVGFILEKPEN